MNVSNEEAGVMTEVVADNTVPRDKLLLVDT